METYIFTRKKKAAYIPIAKARGITPSLIKNILIEKGQKSFAKHNKKGDKFLNAGRGNPNFFNTNK